MKRTTKGAVAAAAAAVLLLGGAGSLAYWSDSDNVTGGTFNSGQLSLVQVSDCDTAAWNLDTGEPGGQPFDPATETLVPGDTVKKICSFTVAAQGTHLRATVDAEPGTNTGDLLPSLTVAATDLAIAGTPDEPLTSGEITEDNDADVLKVTVAVTFNSASDNTTQELQAVLDDIEIVTTQVHS